LSSYGERALTMSQWQNIGQALVKTVKWLIPATCLICRQPHDDARAICADCEHGFSRNRQACTRCALPLQVLDSPANRRSDLGRLSERALCPTCIRHPPVVISAHAPYLMRTGMRDLIHLWKFQNRPHLSPLLADLLLNDLPQADKNSGASEGNAMQRVLVPIPTQWRRQVSRGFDHTWLLAQAIRSHHAEQMIVRSWLRNRRYRPPQHELGRRKRLMAAEDRFKAHPKVAGHHVTLVDDVMTTGATVRGAANTLMRAGSRSVEVWCLARTPAPYNAG
jgi:ComF family protein